MLEPDVMVIPWHPPDWRQSHPVRPALVAEVVESERGIELHRRDKGSLYARAGVPDYWVVNLAERRLEVYRRPFARPEAPAGWTYAWGSLLPPGYSASPLAVEAPIAVADLLR